MAINEDQFEIVVWSHPDYEALVAEASCDQGLFCILSADEGWESRRFEILARKDGKAWNMSADTLRSILTKLEYRLQCMDQPPEHDGRN